MANLTYKNPSFLSLSLTFRLQTTPAKNQPGKNQTGENQVNLQSHKKQRKNDHHPTAKTKKQKKYI